MAIKVHNTLTSKLEEFVPIKPNFVGMYNCGPTVYDYIHIGNLRAFMTADIVRRTFEYSGFEVRQVMNVTDVGIGGDNDEGEDKIIRGLKREGKPVSLESMHELTEFYTERFKEDTAKLNLLPPHVMPKASEHLEEQIKMIEVLEEKGFTYNISDGVYFDTSQYPDYGKLGGIAEENSTQSRIGEKAEKKNSRDFALWKFNSSLGFPSPWGTGFPGWHIECSAMAKKYLGETFDIHTGGIDLAPIHHNNEIAQSENACECKFVRYWLHNEFLNIGEEKMAKSAGNFITIRTVADEGFSPLSYRYFLLQSHYRTKASFTWESLHAAQNAYRKLKEFYVSLPSLGNINNDYKTRFVGAIENDFNTPEALAVVWELVKDENVSAGDKRATLLDFDRVLGLDLEYNEFEVKEMPQEIKELLKKREVARTAGDYAISDELREEIKNLGYIVEDTESGPKILRA
ncbi:MAG: cysteine--tRNA ligase [bacterium]|nr:cysteine--tRNA ligase [bacterium]